LLAFAREVAAFTKDGDLVYKCGNCSALDREPFDRCDQCGTPDQCYSDEHVADGNDDEVDAFYSFIEEARGLLGIEQSEAVDG
jgi:hypothetical protein